MVYLCHTCHRKVCDIRSNKKNEICFGFIRQFLCDKSFDYILYISYIINLNLY